MNWGNKLVLVFVCFGGLTGYLVYRCMQVPVNLVTNDYYKEELVYQNVIDGKNRARTLGSDVRIYQAEQQVVIQLPTEMKPFVTTGDILFYCAASSGKDRKIPLLADSNARQVIPAGTLLPGRYEVKINWSANNQFYYAEQALKIN